MGKWTPAQHRNFKKAMAAKKTAKRVEQAKAEKSAIYGSKPRPSKFDFPIDAIPARRPKITRVQITNSAASKVDLAMAVIQLLRVILAKE